MTSFIKDRGFTLIEVMIVVVIVAILASVALPAYNDYLIRSRITEAVQGLSGRQVRMEQYYQDRRTYSPPDTPPDTPANDCPQDVAAMGKDFEFKCEANDTTFTLTAEGKGTMNGFVYTVNQADARSTTISGAPSGWTGAPTCWVIGKGGAC